MKKLMLPVLLFFMVSSLWAMPPMPGSGHTHDGSVFDDEESAPLFAPALASSISIDSSSAKYPITVSTTGNKTILVIRADYVDLPFDHGTGGTDHNKAYYNDLLQGSSGLTMKKYYSDQSRTQLNLSFYVTETYHAAYGYAHYGTNNAAGNDSNAAGLVKELLTQAALDGDVPSGLDSCTVIVVHSGPGEEAGSGNPPYDINIEKCIWSHRDKLSRHGISPIEVHGTYFDSYLLVPEYYYYNGSFDATIGVFCHEFGHVLGLQDAYDTSYATSGVGQWSLMGGGSWGSVGRAGVASGKDPAPFMAWERLALGWITEEDITPASGDENDYSFSNINDSDKVYTVKLADNQFLLLEGKAKNMTGSGMCVMENGLLVTQLHKGILSTYWSKNNINRTNYRPHGAMVMEAMASNYKTNGLGNLWRKDSTNNRFTETALFRSDTLTSIGFEYHSKSADIPFISIFVDTIIASGFVIALLGLWYAGRKKLCASIVVAAAVVCFSMSCVIEAKESGGDAYDKGPNTNYYAFTDKVHSKTGNSGITIYNIQCNSDGSGSFSIKKD